jgi:putative ABC transport system permease protein
MTARQYLLASLRHYRRSHAAVVLGVAVATAVLTGALVVGDSLRGSLRDLTLERLGRIDHALVAEQPFRAALPAELAKQPGFAEHFSAAVPVLALPGSATAGRGDSTRRVSGVNLLGITPEFWKLDPMPTELGAIPPDEAWLTARLAEELDVKSGDEVVLRLPLAQSAPADSPLGKKQETTRGLRLKVGKILPATGVTNFGLAASQRPPANAFVNLSELQTAADVGERVNLGLIASRDPAEPAGERAHKWLKENLHPQLSDYGLSLEPLDNGMLQLESERLVLPEAVVNRASRLSARSQSIVTYLANSIRLGTLSIPYSTVTGVDSLNGIGPLFTADRAAIRLLNDEIVLNEWAADDLEAKVGDTLTLRYYQPESTHGELIEAQPLELKLKGIVPLAGSPRDPRFAPRLKGVTDRKSISDWELPFELVEKIRSQDEQYWDDYSTTPKAFISHELAAKLWRTRWGTESAIRFMPKEGENAEQIKAKLLASLSPAELGLQILPLKQQGLAASTGSTPFDVLFLLFSMFLIVSAALLIALLFQLAIEHRRRELGLLAAVGLAPQRIRRLLTAEALALAIVGAAIGVLAGIAYARLLIYGLHTWWLDAISTPFIKLHRTPQSLAIGAVAGVAVAWLATRRAIRSAATDSPQRLLLGARESQQAKESVALMRGSWKIAAALCMGCALMAFRAKASAQPGWFFGVGILALVAQLGALRAVLSKPTNIAAPPKFALFRLALGNLTRNAGRTLLAVSLVASATFLILATSAFRLAPTTAGTGGFEFVATSDQPLYYDLATSDGRLELGLSDELETTLAARDVIPLRVHSGEDASCLNLFQTRQPRVLGAPEIIVEAVMSGSFGLTSSEGNSPLAVLEADRGADERGEPIVPVILDQNTAMYSLKLYGGVGQRFTIRDAADQPVTVEIAALMTNSMLQGDLLMSDANFRRRFPFDSGARMFLIGAAKESADTSLAPALEVELADYGFDVESATTRLAGFLGVQNAYLSTFQSLGALGLLLGAVGIAVVQLRNLAERRGELALLQAVGFARSRLQRLIFVENLVVLLLGLAIGAAAALLAILPQLLSAAATLPWGAAVGLVGSVAVCGAIAALLATRRALAAPLVAALRGD